MPNTRVDLTGNELNILNCDEDNPVAIDPDHNPLTLEDFAFAETHVCLPPDIDSELFKITVGGADWGDEISWSIQKEGAFNAWHEGGAPYVYETCPTPAPTACGGAPYEIVMSDSFGDGWNGNEVVLQDCAGDLLFEGATIEDGAEATQQVCLDSSRVKNGQLKAQCGGGYWGSEVSYQVKNGKTGEVVLEASTCPSAVDNCLSCEELGGVNVTVLVERAHLKNGGGEWWDPLADAFVKVRGSSGSQVTKVVNNANDPVWREALWLGCVVPSEPLWVTVMDEDTLDADDELVTNHWEKWASWPHGKLKRLNDTSESRSDSYHKKYFVEVAYTIGHFTPPPVPAPTKAPGDSGGGGSIHGGEEGPTPGGGGGLKKKTSRPTPAPEVWDDDYAPAQPKKKGATKEKGSSKSSGGGGSAAWIVLGSLAAVFCGAGAWFQGRRLLASLLGEECASYADCLGDEGEVYAPMGGSKQSRMHAGMGGFGAPPPPPHGLSGMPMANIPPQGGGNSPPPGGAAGYQPPVLASSLYTAEEEEEVSLGAGNTESAAV